jgi:hypothetical protein
MKLVCASIGLIDDDPTTAYPIDQTQVLYRPDLRSANEEGDR